MNFPYSFPPHYLFWVELRLKLIPSYLLKVCAGTSFADQSACPGDSGGPLMIRLVTRGHWVSLSWYLYYRDSDLRWTIIGIVSTGPAECGATPVIYHRVMASVNWLLDTISGPWQSEADLKMWLFLMWLKLIVCYADQLNCQFMVSFVFHGTLYTNLY